MERAVHRACEGSAHDIDELDAPWTWDSRRAAQLGRCLVPAPLDSGRDLRPSLDLLQKGWEGGRPTACFRCRSRLGALADRRRASFAGRPRWQALASSPHRRSQCHMPTSATSTASSGLLAPRSRLLRHALDQLDRKIDPRPAAPDPAPGRHHPKLTDSGTSISCPTSEPGFCVHGFSPGEFVAFADSSTNRGT
jgi:hypothetical protein